MSASSQRPTTLMERAWDRFSVLIGSLAASASSVSSPSSSRHHESLPLTTTTSSNNNHTMDNNNNNNNNNQSSNDSNSMDNNNKSSTNDNDSSNDNRMPTRQDWIDLGIDLTLRLLFAVTTGYLMLWITKRFALFQQHDDENGDHYGDSYSTTRGGGGGAITKRLQAILRKRQDNNNNNNNKKVVVPPLSSYERQMAQEILDPSDIDCSFADIGGLDDTKREIYELAVLPLIKPELFKGKLVQPCKGILLYGKPGTGKTMLAKALAKESQAVFLPLHLSKILNKWVGESNKLIAATFSLAHKLQPAIIFIDELDTFLKANTTETQYLDSIKAEFLTLWDGITSKELNERVLVLGATNKPQTIDSAILRRMPRTFYVPLPDTQGRLAILTRLLQDERVEHALQDFLPELALQHTVGYSGSDLKELCKAAAMVAIQERTKEFAHRRVMGNAAVLLDDDDVEQQQRNNNILEKELRPISKPDMLLALQKVQRTGAAASAYGRQEVEEQQRLESSADVRSLRNLRTLLRSLSALPVDENGSNDDNNMPTV